MNLAPLRLGVRKTELDPNNAYRMVESPSSARFRQKIDPRQVPSICHRNPKKAGAPVRLGRRARQKNAVSHKPKLAQICATVEEIGAKTAAALTRSAWSAPDHFAFRAARHCNFPAAGYRATTGPAQDSVFMVV
jgi:hypothetical protein